MASNQERGTNPRDGSQPKREVDLVAVQGECVSCLVRDGKDANCGSKELPTLQWQIEHTAKTRIIKDRFNNVASRADVDRGIASANYSVLGPDEKHRRLAGSSLPEFRTTRLVAMRRTPEPYVAVVGQESDSSQACLSHLCS